MQKSLNKNWFLGPLAVGVFALGALCTSFAPAEADNPAPTCYVTQEVRREGSATAYCASLQPFEEFPTLRVHVVNDDQGRLLGVEVLRIEPAPAAP